MLEIQSLVIFFSSKHLKLSHKEKVPVYLQTMTNACSYPKDLGSFITSIGKCSQSISGSSKLSLTFTDLPQLCWLDKRRGSTTHLAKLGNFSHHDYSNVEISLSLSWCEKSWQKLDRIVVPEAHSAQITCSHH